MILSRMDNVWTLVYAQKHRLCYKFTPSDILCLTNKLKFKKSFLIFAYKPNDVPIKENNAKLINIKNLFI